MKHTLEGLKYTDRAIASYEGMNDRVRELIERTGYTGGAQARMNEYTSRKLEEERTYYNYWHDLITKIEDDRYRNILTMRYIKGLTVEVVAEELFYTVSHTYRLTNQAVKELAELHEKQAHSKGYKGQFIQR